MKKVQRNAKSLLFENMAKLNPNFKVSKEILTEDDKWIQNAVNPEHKGYCTPMSKSTCTPQRKALAKRFKKGIEDEAYKLDEVENWIRQARNVNERGNIDDFSDTGADNEYQDKANKIKQAIDDLLRHQMFDAIDGIYTVVVDRSSKRRVPTALAEDSSAEYRMKVEKLKGKIDFLFNTNHLDIIDKVDAIIEKLFPNNNEPEFNQ